MPFHLPSHLPSHAISLDTIKKIYDKDASLSFYSKKKSTYLYAWPVMPCTIGGYGDFEVWCKAVLCQKILLTASFMKESGALRNEHTVRIAGQHNTKSIAHTIKN